MSANSTVTTRRSSLGAVGSPLAPTAMPHAGQKRAVGGTTSPHAPHVRVRISAPHAMQNRATSGFATPHEGQATSTEQECSHG